MTPYYNYIVYNTYLNGENIYSQREDLLSKNYIPYDII